MDYLIGFFLNSWCNTIIQITNFLPKYIKIPNLPNIEIVFISSHTVRTVAIYVSRIKCFLMLF